MKNAGIGVLAILMIIPGILAGCGETSRDQYAGEWVSVTESGSASPVNWVKISKVADGYIWENADGSFPAAEAEGCLEIDFDGFPATAEFDKETGVLTFAVHGNSIEFTRKE